MNEWQSLSHVRWECEYHIVIEDLRFKSLDEEDCY